MIIYFSGTGNTLLVVKKMKEVFEKQSITVNLYRIEKTQAKDLSIHTMIGLAFPVACQGTYQFVWDFFKELPWTEGTPVFMVDTLAAFSGGVVGPLKKIMRNKGYNPIGAREILMPSNFFTSSAGARLGKYVSFRRKISDDEKIKKGLTEAARYAYDIVQGQATWGRIPIVSDILSIASQSGKSFHSCRKWVPLTVDRALCTKCGLCKELCPVGNIEMNEFPHVLDRCQLCMRCIAFCPAGAMCGAKVTDKAQRSHYKPAVSVNEILV